MLAALPPLVERIRTLCRRAPGRDPDGSRNRNVIFGPPPPVSGDMENCPPSDSEN